MHGGYTIPVPWWMHVTSQMLFVEKHGGCLAELYISSSAVLDIDPSQCPMHRPSAQYLPFLLGSRQEQPLRSQAAWHWSLFLLCSMAKGVMMG